MHARCWMNLLFVALFPLCASAREIKAGDSQAQVKREMGNPRGEFTKGDSLFLLYDQGLIELRNGEVVRADLMSKEEAARVQTQRKIAESAARRQQESERAAQRARGEAEKQRLLADAALSNAAPAEVVRTWEQFLGAFPDVDAAAELQAARDQLARQQEEDRIRELEKREAELALIPEPKQLSSSKQRKEDRAARYTNQPGYSASLPYPGKP